MDPITFEIIRHRLYRVIHEAIITLKHVSGSAITNEGHDLMVSLYRADGSLLMGGVGFLHHLTSAAEACKHVIRSFAGEIGEGDVFLLNDPYTAALHTSDIYLIAPIHYDGALIAWSACFVHVYDIGAVNPGGFSPDSRDIFTEGFSSPGIKLVDGGKMREDVMRTFLNMVRSPEMVTLDVKSMIACNNVASERLRVLMDKYGARAVDEVGRQLIEDSERFLRGRLGEIPDGSWRAREYMDVLGEVFGVNLTMTKQGEDLTFDFTGSSPQSSYGINCTYWASWGGLFAPLFPMLCHDLTWNEGLMRPVTMIAPEGTVVNCTRPAPISVATVAAIHAVNMVSGTALAKMLAASETLQGEVTGGWHGSNTAIFVYGRNQRGREVIGIMTESFAGSGGARSFADGVDLGGEMPNPISRYANVETIEANYPIRYLFRKRRLDSGGAGRYRGGTGGEYAIVAHDAPEGELHFSASGKGTLFPMTEGVCGGHAGAPCRFEWVHADGTDHGTSAEEIRGRREALSWGVFPLEGEDAFHARWSGGGGYGDPLQRDPEAVRADVLDDLVSAERARDIYGVVLAGDDRDGEVDLAATADLRRRQRSAPGRAKAEAAAWGLSPTLAIGDGEAGKVMQCAGCGARLGPAGAPWKSHAVLREEPIGDLDGMDESASRVVRRQFTCAGCGALLDTETALAGDPFLDDLLFV